MSAIDYRKLLLEERERVKQEMTSGKSSSESTIEEVKVPLKSPQNKFQQKQPQPLASASASASAAAAVVNFTSILPPPPEIIHEHALQDYPGLYYLPDAISVETESRLLTAIEQTTDCVWEFLRGRRLQQWGAVPHSPMTPAKPSSSQSFSPWLNLLADELVRWEVFPNEFRPNNALINHYESDEGILHHTDGPRYHPCVAILSLHSDCVMTFRPNLSTHEIGIKSDADVLAVVLRARSLFVFSQKWYTDHLHGIAADQDIIPIDCCLPPIANAVVAGVKEGDVVRNRVVFRFHTFQRV
eukprot:gene9880-10927_t